MTTKRGNRIARNIMRRKPAKQTPFDKWLEECPLTREQQRKGFTLIRLSALLGVSVTTLQFWKSGTRTPTDEHFAQMKQHLGVNPEVWRRWTKKKPQPATTK